MSNVVISARGLGKAYVIGKQIERERYRALRDVIARSAASWASSARAVLRGDPEPARHAPEEFWALKDVSFDISRGEVVGIIGRNGAGKSTLLKVLSRITEPSAGRVVLNGRVASLLEVGTGFHPELTGRENIFLNGAILGMTRAEIRRKFDEIVGFSDVERFLDTPVKRYSSGMYVRLAFAVAAHLEPEILVVDEVLAVGDAEFQKKCIGKMQDVAGHGRTVLFVSHNMAAVRRLCTRGILLAGGRVAASGPVESVIARYTGDVSRPVTEVDLRGATRRGSGEVQVARLALASGPDGLAAVPIFGELHVSVGLRTRQSEVSRCCIWLLVRNASGDDVAMVMQKDSQGFQRFADGAAYACNIPCTFAPGRYTLTAVSWTKVVGSSTGSTMPFLSTSPKGSPAAHRSTTAWGSCPCGPDGNG